jgi:SAM-dependent methyltransferase
VKGVPADYYRRLDQADRNHWFHRGMEQIALSLLGDRVARATGLSLLDAGCGTGGFLRFARGLGVFERLCGIDLSAEAVALARAELPEADLRIGRLTELPFEPSSFDVVALNDVLQHIDESELDASLWALRRALKPTGALVLRTNGARAPWRARSDWRLYDPASLGADLRRGGFRVERMTYANTAVSVLRAARGLTPGPPTDETTGIPGPSGAAATAIGSRLLALEARYLAGPGRSLPYGHTLLAVASPG